MKFTVIILTLTILVILYAIVGIVRSYNVMQFKMMQESLYSDLETAWKGK